MSADAKEELLLELKSKNTTRSIKDFSPEGIRLESNLEGEAKGVYNATFYATITMLVKPDRTIDYEVRQIHTTSDGDTVLVYYKGKSIIESPTHNKFVGETTFQTSSKKLAWRPFIPEGAGRCQAGFRSAVSRQQDVCRAC